MIIDPSGRGPTMRQLLIAGVVMLLILAVALALLMLRYTGYFTSKVPVTASLTTTGDGLPSQADVKFRGALVGTVDSVEVAAMGEKQEVAIDIKPEFADRVPSTVTARVVPSNVFAVTSIELLDNGPAPGLTEGAVIQEDTSKSTVALQTTLTTLRSVLDNIEPEKLGNVLGSLSEALEPSGRVPGSTIERLDRWVTSIDGAIPDLGVFLGDFSQAAQGLNQSAPELIDVLSNSVTTARTLAEKRSQMTALLTSGGGTFDTVNALFARNPDSGKVAVSGLNETFGALATDPSAITGTFTNLDSTMQKLGTIFSWGPSKQMAWKINASFTPFEQYTASDCPNYGDLYGPRCGGSSVPSVAPQQPLPPELAPRRLDAAGPAPLVSALPSIPGMPTIPGLPNIPGVTPPVTATPASATTELRGPAAVAEIVGRQPTGAQMLLLSPAIAGNTLQVTDTSAEGGQR